jgi:large subunit ribosomal protein L9
MKIILLDDVTKVGRRGEVRDVSDGYARNFLIPKKLALSATAGNLKNLERVKADAESLRAKIEGLVYEQRRQASEEGKLFGSVTSQDVADFLGTRGIPMDRKRITLEEPIKALGEHSVSMRLHPDVVAQLRVNVVRE